MRSATAEIPYTWMTNRFSQSSDFTFTVQTEEVVKVGGGIRADDGSYAFAEVASEAGG
jgi:hypothetical protein